MLCRGRKISLYGRLNIVDFIMLGIILLIYSVIIITWKYDTRTLLYYYIFLKHKKNLELQGATYIRQVAVYLVKAFVGNEYVYFNGLVSFLVNNESIVVGVLLVDGDIALFTISADFFSVGEFAQQHCIGSTLCGV